jgi:hypothetical protein
MTSKRASKSKSAKGVREEMAKVSGLEVHPSCSKGHAKVREGEACRLQSRPSRHRMRLLLPISSSRRSPVPFEAGQQRHRPFALKSDELAKNVSTGRRLSYPLPIGILSGGPNARRVLTMKSSLCSDGNRRHSSKNGAKASFHKDTTNGICRKLRVLDIKRMIT